MREISVKRFLINWIAPLAIAFVLVWMLRLLVIEFYYVQNNSMKPSIEKGDLVMVNKFKVIKRNTLIAFYYPLEKNSTISSKSILLKRCVALPGDTLIINNGKLTINSVLQPDSFCLYNYRILIFDSLENKALINNYKLVKGYTDKMDLIVPLSERQYQKIKSDSIIRYIQSVKDEKDLNHPSIFPHSYLYRWNKDFFGPLVVPKKGSIVTITKKNMALYKRVLTVYEGNTVKITGDVIYINNKKADYYTFKQNYVMVLNDYRDNADDSRQWGFVPQNHIIGKVTMIWK